MISLCVILLALCQFLIIHSYPYFQQRIPNGDKVPNPCNPSQIWQGVGHLNDAGGGPRNPFGLDFQNGGEVWNSSICNKDSDGDGRTNGQELGDPNCTWTSGSTPQGPPIGHPGICEPLSSPNCTARNSWLACAAAFATNSSSNNSNVNTPIGSMNGSSNGPGTGSGTGSNNGSRGSLGSMPGSGSPLNCPAFSLPSTRSINLTIPPTTIPAQHTTYMCIGFTLPNDTQYQAIGLLPFLNQTNNVHHMLLYGCKNPLPESELTTPYQCGMGSLQCQSLIGIWAVGAEGTCYSDQYGIPFGSSNSFTYALLQIHYNNPELQSGLVDSSGVTLYYTNQLRPNNAQILMSGQQYINIPPHTNRTLISGTCKSNCTALLNNSVNIAAAVLHMHLTGVSGSVQLKRGQNIVTIINDPVYDFNLPRQTLYNPALQFNPGDEIITNCVYSSVNRNTTTGYGESTDDEMCYSFLTIYPAVENFDSCTQWQDIDVCTLSTELTYSVCDINTFRELLGPVATSCNASTCQTDPVCQDLIRNMSSTGCTNGSIWQFTQWAWVQVPQLQAFQINELFDLIDTCGNFAAYIVPGGVINGPSSSMNGSNSGSNFTSSITNTNMSQIMSTPAGSGNVSNSNMSSNVSSSGAAIISGNSTISSTAASPGIQSLNASSGNTTEASGSTPARGNTGVGGNAPLSGTGSETVSPAMMGNVTMISNVMENSTVSFSNLMVSPTGTGAVSLGMEGNASLSPSSMNNSSQTFSPMGTITVGLSNQVMENSSASSNSSGSSPVMASGTVSPLGMGNTSGSSPAMPEPSTTMGNALLPSGNTPSGNSSDLVAGSGGPPLGAAPPAGSPQGNFSEVSPSPGGSPGNSSGMPGGPLGSPVAPPGGPSSNSSEAPVYSGGSPAVNSTEMPVSPGGSSGNFSEASVSPSGIPPMLQPVVGNASNSSLESNGNGTNETNPWNSAVVPTSSSVISFVLISLSALIINNVVC